MEKNICLFCNHNVSSEDNFCSNCGEPLSASAQKLKHLEKENTQLMLIGDILTILKDKTDIENIKKLVLEIKNNK